MRMHNFEIEPFIDFLMELELSGKDSRMRSRFCNFAKQRVQVMENERMELIREFAYKDEEGNPQIVDNAYNLKDKEGFAREYNILRYEMFIMNKTPDQEEMLDSIRESVLNTEMKFKGEQAMAYDRFCDIVESE